MITLSVSGTKRIVTAVWSGEKTKLDPVVEGSARHWYPMGYGRGWLVESLCRSRP